MKFLKILQLASGDTVHPLVFGVEFGNEHFLSLLPEQAAGIVNFFNYSDHHVTLFVTLAIEVLACHLLGVVVPHITKMF